jgi:hypothetical protein
MKKSNQLQLFALKLQAQIKEDLYRNSPLRNKFQVRPVEQGEVKTFENAKNARIMNESFLIEKIKNKSAIVPFFQLDCSDKLLITLESYKSKSNYKTIYEDMLNQEKMIFKAFKKHLTKKKQGILLILSDFKVYVNDKNIGFTASEQIGVIVLNK